MSTLIIKDLQIRIEGDAQDFSPDNRRFILEIPGENVEFDITPLLVKSDEA